ncbi:hypothetical protein TraAM80_07653 [Trypanosoma rangeli]|uniref:Uncharacterized protein n=1 Tax=Trypanosoma rangeli TaxID=5698 RepID=A0A3R7KS96_TRYRA|nr:uncharacterized protein TraAM80_07653 [Trypanosoma rangeli]RNF00360.1 hypothetical protein TraAM80_07653 [Trypanosoma rangeli]|eukprot:RNF00360.1 hypothetical protein TraAM80_07653 [Trypanosoma rangeli]
MMLRKRYRPLDAAEERSVDVEHKLRVGLLYDEQSYCFSWPDAPLTAMLRCSNASLTPAFHGNMVSPTQASIAQPPIFTVDRVAAEHGQSEFVASLSASHPAIPFSSGDGSLGRRSNGTQRCKRHQGGPVSAATEDSIFSFNAHQIQELKEAGAFNLFREALSQRAPNSINLDNEEELGNLGRREMENEIVRLEWRAFHESEKTAPSLQRILLLTSAVPFIENAKSNRKEISSQTPHEWQRIVYDLWVKWRCGTPMSGGSMLSGSNTLPWGSPLLPGAFLSSETKEYFLTGNNDHNGFIKAGRSSERRGGEGAARQLPAATIHRRRGAYGYLRWRIDLYEPRLRSSWAGDRGENRDRGAAKMLSATEVSKLIDEKIPAALAEVKCEERADPVDALALTDIRNEVETWRQWLAHV